MHKQQSGQEALSFFLLFFINKTAGYLYFPKTGILLALNQQDCLEVPLALRFKNISPVTHSLNHFSTMWQFCS